MKGTYVEEPKRKREDDEPRKKKKGQAQQAKPTK